MTQQYKKINFRKEREEQLEKYKNRIIYSLPVRAGYWANELAIREQQEFLYNYKKEHCQLLIQKTRKMFRNLLKPILLAQESPHILYNQNYQIKSHGMSEISACGLTSVHPLYLSGIISEKEIDTTQHFVHGCILSASPDKSPCVRNTYSLIGCDSKRTGAVCYGEDVYLKISESQEAPLYVQCENATMDTFGEHLNLRLSQIPDMYCRFKFFHWKPDLRFETSGTFLLPNDYVIIQHTASGHNLSAEFHKRLPTFFGPEYIISCQTFRDTHRMETIENLWKISGVEKTENK